MKILVTGSSGFIGSHAILFLKNRGCEVIQLKRIKNDFKLSAAEKSTHLLFREETKEFLNEEILDDLYAIINLSGSSIADGRWTDKMKNLIYSSRVVFTRNLFYAFQKTAIRPQLVISVSGVGIYAETNRNCLVFEKSPTGNSFLAEISKAWEMEAARFCDIGAHVVIFRLGVVLSPNGGVLKQMLPIFKSFLGGPFGDGEQSMPWISLEDVLEIFYWALTRETSEVEIFNAVSPDLVSNKEFVGLFAQKLNRPNFFRVPKFIISMVLGEMGRELLLSGLKVYPRNLLAAGYRFQYKNLSKFFSEKLRPFNK